MFIKSRFRPGWWNRNRHVQTIWAAVFRRLPQLPAMQRWRLELDDGDFIDVDLHLKRCPDEDKTLKTEYSVILLLHGLEGTIDSTYIRGMITRFANEGKQVALMYFRSCSGESNRLLKSYHSGVSDDLQVVIDKLAQRNIRVEYLVGFSLGGNVLLKWLGEVRRDTLVKAAVAVSVPLQLEECANSIDQGFSRIYSGRLLKSLKIKAWEKKKQFIDKITLNEEEILSLNTFWEFDQKMTAPLHGYKSASDYYEKVSGRQFLKSIDIPTLVIHAKDDPFMNTKVIPEEQELSPAVQFELSDNGGHVGFIEGKWPWKPRYYLDSRIPEFLDQHK